MENSQKDLRSKTIHGISWSILAQGSRQFFQIIIGILLARLLTPEVFGLVAMITVFTGFANLFIDLGFSSALIQKQDIKATHLDTVFWINIGFGATLTGLFYFLAPYIAAFYNEPILIPLILFLSFSFFIGSLGIVHQMLLRRSMDFKKLATVEISSILVSGIVAIILALYGFGVWSLAVKLLLVVSLEVALFWTVSSWRPSFRFSKNAFNDLWAYSANLIGFRSVNYWFRKADNLLIGKFLSSSALGIYDNAYRLMIFPLRNISHTISKVMFPAFAIIQDDKKKISRIYLKMIQTVALITFPMMLGLFVIANEFVIAVFGLQWAAMIPVLRLLSLSGMIQSIVTLNGILYQSQGRTDLQFKVGGTVGLFGVLAIAIGIFWGENVFDVALAYTIYFALAVGPSIHIAVSQINLTFLDVLKRLVPILLCSLLMGCSVYLFKISVEEHVELWALLILEIVVGASIYILILHIFNVKSYKNTKKMFMEEFRKKFYKKF